MTGFLRLAVIAISWAALGAQAQPYPAKPIRKVVRDSGAKLD